ncbi:MAG: GGDEF domain-containing protein [Moraxellaceae bacterium]|nr:MAG: GGDEF domain-containing protein [Moraxellaceae bacterium]
MANNQQQELLQAVQFLRLTIPRMSNLAIPITPENYTVWYEYSSGVNLDLNRAIDDFLNNGVEFTPEVNRELYDTYIPATPNGKIAGVQGETEQIVLDLLNEIKSMHEGAQKFTGTLESSQEELKNNPSISSVSRLIANLIDETDRVKRVNSSMERKLTAMKQEVSILKTDMETLSVKSLTDQLTGIANRRAYNGAIDRFLANFKENQCEFSLLMIDIDHFKRFNDTYGHSVGDMVLSFVAKKLKNVVKGTDFVARYGGEEFVVLLPATDYEGAKTVGQILCDNVAQTTLTLDEGDKKVLGNVTISVGVAMVTSEDDAASIVARGDRALYAAKEKARNCVVGERELPL